MSNSIFGCPFHNNNDIKEFDALDPETRANPYPFYKWLREDEERRIYKLPQENSFYIVHKHEDVKKVLTNHKEFGNHILPTKTSPFFALLDGENHLRIRSVVSKVLNIKNKDFPLDDIEKNIEFYTQKVINKKEVELFEKWANPIPISTLCAIFGLENSSVFIEDLHQKSITINRAFFALGATGPRRDSKPNFKEKLTISSSIIGNLGLLRKLYLLVGASGMGEFKDMFFPESSNLEFPRPDFNQLPMAISPLLELMTMFGKILTTDRNKSIGIKILRQSITDGDISIPEAIMACAFIIFAGYETTTSLLSNCVAHLAHHPKTHTQLKTHPETLDAFIDEAIRMYTPVGRFIRRAKKEVVIGNSIIPKDALVIVMLGAANTDPEVFNDPFSFDTERTNQQQNLSFGKGIHFCLGANLAKFQIKTSLQKLIAGTKMVELNANFDYKMVTDRDNGILRYEELHMRLTS